MDFDLENEHAPLAYKLLTTVVTPRPIALVTTVSDTGVVNAAPFSFFNVFGSRPPIVALAPGDRSPGIPKDTASNILSNGEFVVHITDAPIAEKMVACATSLPPGESEPELAGFTTTPSATVSVPRIAEAPVAIECVEHTTLKIGQNRLVVGRVRHLFIRDGILDPSTLHLAPGALEPVGRMHGGDGYCHTSAFFTIPRPD